MSDDGADLGMTAGQALKGVMGGDQPNPDERMRVQEMEALIRSRPLPVGPVAFPDGDGYSVCAEIIAHCFLVLADDDPGILDRETFYPDDYEYEELRGKPYSKDHAPWEAMKERWPDYDAWVGGATGFMVGWALNAARTVKALPPAPNPAIVKLG